MRDAPTTAELRHRIEELEETEQRLKDVESRLLDEVFWRRLLIEESRDGIVIVDSGAKVYEANRRFADMLGYTMDEVRQLHVWDWDLQFTREQILEMADLVDEQGHHFTTRMRRKDGSVIAVELSNNGAVYRSRKLIFCVCRDVTDAKRATREREELIDRLRESLAEIKTLRGILPLCSYCKKVRDDSGYWEQVEVYLSEHAGADVTHSICPDCLQKHFPDHAKGIYPRPDPGP